MKVSEIAKESLVRTFNQGTYFSSKEMEPYTPFSARAESEALDQKGHSDSDNLEQEGDPR